MKPYTAALLLFLAVKVSSMATGKSGPDSKADLPEDPCKPDMTCPHQGRHELTGECCCCQRKTVGGISYIKVEYPGRTVPENCLNDCIYMREGEAGGSRFCFAHGSLPVVCEDDQEAPAPVPMPVPSPTPNSNPSDNDESCRIVASGPFGAPAPKEFLFNDRIVASNGKITQIAFRVGSLMDQIQATYGNVQSPPHGGAGGVPTGPYILQGSDIIKVEGIVRTRQGQQYIQSLTFTDQTGRVHGPFGPTDSSTGSLFESAPNNCFLRYLSGSTTGNDTQTALGNFETFGNYVNQLTLNWCCP